MDIYEFLIGFAFLLVGITITILQRRSRVYNKKEDFNWENVQFTSAAIIGYISGIF